MCTNRDRQANSGLNRYNFFPVSLLAPHFTLPGEKKPDFFDGPVGDGDLDLIGRQ